MLRSVPATASLVTTGGPPPWKYGAVASAYLRIAQAYMLISMPTGTSTILGVFQAILALLVKGTNSALPAKLVGNGNYASGIFCHEFNAAVQKKFTGLCGRRSNQSRFNGFRLARSTPEAGRGSTTPAGFG